MTLTSLYNNEARDLALWKTKMPNEPEDVITNLVLVESDNLTKFTAGENHTHIILKQELTGVFACLESQDRGRSSFLESRV